MESTESNLSGDRRDILKQFRCNLKDVLTPAHTDAVLLKWLRARKYDLRKTELLFREVQDNRKTYGLDTIIETFSIPKVLSKYGRTWFLGFDKEGSPVRYVDLHMDYSGILHSASAYDICLYCCHFIESDVRALMQHRNEERLEDYEITYIFNLEGYSIQDAYSKCVIETGLDIFALYQDHFPEKWKSFLLINVPYVFEKLLNLFKPILGAAFLEKLKIVPKGEATNQLLKEYLDDDVLPAFLGGSRVDSKGDPYCREFLKGYRKIPEEYYLLNSMHLISETDPGVKIATIRARRVFNVPLVVKKAGERIRVEIRTDKGSIFFSILYRNTDSNLKTTAFPENEEYLDPNDENSDVRVVGTRMRTQCHIAPYDGIITATWPGLYIFQFDNTSSWIGSRKLYYRITVSPPDA